MIKHYTINHCPQCDKDYSVLYTNRHQICCSPECAFNLKRRPFVDRFWEKVNKTDSCWNWTGAISKTSGYGLIRFEGRQTQPHRVSWQLTHGPIINGLHVCHHCDNRRCVRPDHLFLGTPKENAMDMLQKEREARGEKLPQAKLTATDIPIIRASLESGDILAARYGIAKSSISQIRHRKVWKHIP